MKIDLQKMAESIKDSNITVEKHPTEELYIYGYYKNPLSKEKNIWNEYSVKCRGLILDKEGNIIERAFDKFWTFRNHITENIISLSENKMVKLPDSRPKIYEKLDGTMGILYWVNDVPYMATQRSFSCLKAMKGSEIIQKKYHQEALKLNRKYSYVFEVIYPEAGLIVNYGETEDVVLIGVIDKETGKSMENIADLGFKIKKDLTDHFGAFTSLAEIEESDMENLEGVVLEYDHEVRIKIKFPWYKEVHKDLQNIFNAEYQIAESVHKLKKYYGYERTPLSSVMIEEALKNGDRDLSGFMSKVNIDLIDRGAMRWTRRHLDNYLENKTIINESFYDSVEFTATPDDRIWNWKNRYLDKYYD